MCIAISLPGRYRTVRERVSVHTVIETLVFRNDLRQVVVSFDCIIRNESDEPIDVWMTHVDNVEGRLATEDWRSPGRDDVDERTWLVETIHDDCWQADFDAGLLRYRDPVKAADGFATVARILSFRRPEISVAAVSQLHADFIDPKTPPYRPPGSDEDAAVYKLLSFPEAGRTTAPNGDALPFTTFRIGPIVPSKDGIGTAFRLTVLVAKETYRRIVQPQEDAPFYVYGAERVLHEIQDEIFPQFQSDRRSEVYRSFFSSEILDTLITPESYQIVIAQPNESDQHRRCVLVRPTSSRVSERVVPTSEARRRALWFNAWSPDFSMVLKYGDRRASDFDGYRMRLPQAVTERRSAPAGETSFGSESSTRSALPEL